MAKAVYDDAAALWLPSQFFADNENRNNVNENKNNVVNADFDAALVFPSEFPYEFELSSPAGSTGTESSDEEEDFFAGLTRRLSQSSLHETRKQLITEPISARDKPNESQKKTRVLSGSPQSTLSGIGSWSGRSAISGDGSPNGFSRVPSPSTTPFAEKNDPWEIIYAAAGEVARMKMNGEVTDFDFQNNRELLSLPRVNMFSNQSLNQLQMKQQCGSVWGTQAKNNWLVQQQQQQQLEARNRERNVVYESVKCTCPLSLPQSSWPPLQLHNQNQRPVQFSGSGSRVVLPGGSSVKRGSGGTGVFLPRHYDNPSDSRKKTSCAPVMLPPAKVIHGLNLNIDDLNATNQSRFSNAFAPNYDALLARRNAILMLQRLRVRQEEVANYETRLPQEWTY
ncbi:uncharacterized protein LOC133289530 [Gastrolobium bilobum]|uniref:uncharacterized protein LOC133289530 n=1 Tax=Gastrolobium bilobum TaxID=150636 RepID=UPI002AB205A3|nr:uncharacterized protein LOC133289530 [Gastrolobium bilobum]